MHKLIASILIMLAATSLISALPAEAESEAIIPKAKLVPIAPAVVSPDATMEDMNELQTRQEPLLSLITFTDNGCSNNLYHATLNVGANNTCHAYDGADRSMYIYYSRGLCKLYVYSDSSCSRGAAIAAYLYGCYAAAPEYYSYKVLC